MKICDSCKHSVVLNLTGVRLCKLTEPARDCRTITHCDSKPVTNFDDMIMAMTPESLAEMICGDYPQINNACSYCVNKGKRHCDGSNCTKHIQEYLERAKA